MFGDSVEVADQATDRLIDDDRGTQEDQERLGRGARVLELLVPVGVGLVGGLLGFADRDEGDHGGDQVRRGLHGVAQDGHRAGEQSRTRLEGDQCRVRPTETRAARRFDDPLMALSIKWGGLPGKRPSEAASR